ncbi:hypothetical protein [Roseibium sp. RKSG952]|uniref:hypothetical protein n=1 Tax=Roseibium sp. RKSG952 TaxID=2529384 RepID=UPI0012BB7CCE|nr:hypothetical protein [Roseibium sp. RKSG952]MTH99660.1 hypothetical protein [Roseibium sp. RKSG952]
MRNNAERDFQPLVDLHVAATFTETEVTADIFSNMTIQQRPKGHLSANLSLCPQPKEDRIIKRKGAGFFVNKNDSIQPFSPFDHYSGNNPPIRGRLSPADSFVSTDGSAAYNIGNKAKLRFIN